ncbi:rCG58553, isoform CRA_a [Rattus norvegicus]|uniref:RCG58553, isoform CRA_a n=1 Tax=Rattus norvegicus TaxID=10116 RepID=A6K6Y7_RAT|nr:rCG58553, isoform CRA_a [Rattus norvegicus]EDL99707.1 rCG58553, isoform CRA_a [Rattus norvegicus]
MSPLGPNLCAGARHHLSPVPHIRGVLCVQNVSSFWPVIPFT